MDKIDQAERIVPAEVGAPELDWQELDAVTGAGGPVFPPCVTGSTSPYCKP